MNKYPLIGGSILVVVLLILGSLTTVVGYQIVQSSTEKVTIQTNFVTVQGVEHVEKEISLQDAQRISSLINGSDVEALASELMRLGLVPASIPSEQVRDLISGEYGKRECSKFNSITKRYASNERLKSLYCNVLCSIQGEARDCIYFGALEMITFGIGWTSMLLSLLLMELFPSRFPLIPIPFIFYTYVGVLFLVGAALCLLADYSYLFRINPVRATPILWSLLSDGPHEQKVNVSTRGLLGNWTMQSFDISLLLLGFLGVWITISDTMNTPGCSFRGFSIFAGARDCE